MHVYLPNYDTLTQSCVFWPSRDMLHMHAVGMCKPVVLNLVGGTEPNKFHTCINVNPTSSIHAFIEAFILGKIKCVS